MELLAVFNRRSWLFAAAGGLLGMTTATWCGLNPAGMLERLIAGQGGIGRSLGNLSLALGLTVVGAALVAVLSKRLAEHWLPRL